MNKPTTLSRLACLTALAAGSALMTTDIANAGWNQRHRVSRIEQGHPGNNAKRYGLRPQFVISGQPVNVKRVLHRHKKKPHEVHCQTHCFQPAQTAPKGNPAQPATTAGHAAPAINRNGMNSTASFTSPGTIRPRDAVLTEPKKEPESKLSRTVKKVLKFQDASGKAAGFVPVAGAVGAGIVGHPGMGIIGTIKHGNPITGPVQETADFVKDYATGVVNIVEDWF
jgi:hypothetical protein